MKSKPTLKPQDHLFNILSSSERTPAYSLFLGSGASVTSGVPLGSELIRKWRREYAEAYCPREDIDVAIQSQDWFEAQDEYAQLFELLYDRPSQRRAFMERCIADARPSWGYAYLVDMLENNIFNTVFTTNFDDLLIESCYLYSDTVRPIVCAHDSTLTHLRISSARPKLVKLHGDFLFDNIKNTQREVESLESNMRAKFMQFAREYGLIVIGYAGQDRSIMEVLDTLLRSADSFPHGVYWCTSSGKLSEPVKELQRFPQVTVIKISGFDDFMSSLHQSLGLPTIPIVSSPLTLIANRLTALFNTLDTHNGMGYPIITKDALNLGIALNNLRYSQPALDIPYSQLIALAVDHSEWAAALEFALAHFECSPTPSSCHAVVEYLSKEPNDKLLERLLATLDDKNCTIWNSDPNISLRLYGTLIDLEYYEPAERLIEIAIAICREQDNFNWPQHSLNQALAHMLRTGRLAAKQRKELTEISELQTQDAYFMFCMDVINDDLESASNRLKRLSTEKSDLEGYAGIVLYNRKLSGPRKTQRPK